MYTNITKRSIALRYYSLFFVLILFMHLASAADSSSASVSGSIKVEGTILKTEGAKSDKDVVVYLEKVGIDESSIVPQVSVMMDQKGSVFIPHVLPIQKGTTVDFKNSDSTDHNVFCVDDCCVLVEDIDAKKPHFLDLGNFPGGEQASYTFSIPGEGVILCKLHPEMAAYIIVLDTSHFTLAQIDSETQSTQFSIGNVPNGEYILKTWNKKTTSLEQSITVSNGKDTNVGVSLQKKQRKRRKR